MKRVEQQALVALTVTRAVDDNAHGAGINALRGILREHGILLPVGAVAAVPPVSTILDEADTTPPRHLGTVLTSVHAEVRSLDPRVAEPERDLRTVADPVFTPRGRSAESTC